MDEISTKLQEEFEAFIVAGVKEDKLTLFTSTNITFPQALQLLSSALLNYMNKVVSLVEANLGEDKDKEEKVSKLKGEVYDMVNVAASNVLYMFAPEIENHPDLTTEAILKAENEILDDMDKDEEHA